MKNLLNTTIYLLLFILASISCKDKYPHCNGKWDERLNFVNNSDSAVYVVHSVDYPDTISTNLENHSKARLNYYEKKASGLQLELCDWDDYYNQIESGIVMFFVILDEGQTQEKILENHTLLKRYDLTLQDLESMNWKLVYP